MAGERSSKRQRDVLDRLGVPRAGPADDPEAAGAAIARRLLDLARALLVPLVAYLGLISGQTSAGFWSFMAAGVVWQALGLLVHRRLGRRLAIGAMVPVDLALTAALLATSGGSDSPLRLLLLIGPVAAGYLLPPATVAAIGGGIASCYVLVALPDLLDGAEASGERLALIGLELAYATAAGVAFALGRRTLERSAAQMDAARRRQLTAGLTAEDRERRRVSHDLHGEALQILLAAAQDLEEADGEALGRARAGIRSGVAALRDTVRDLHPAAVRHAGLAAAVRTSLEHRVREVLAVRVAPDAEGVREALVLSVVRDVGDAIAGTDPAAAVAANVAWQGERLAVLLRARAPGPDVARLRGALVAVADGVEADGGSFGVRLGAGGEPVVAALLRPSAQHGPRPADDDDAVRRRSLGLFNALRLLLVPLTVAVGVVCGDPGPAFVVLVGVLGAYYVAITVIGASSRWRRVPGRWGSAFTLALFAGAVAAQGGLTTDLPAVALSFPFLFVLAFTPRQAAQLDLVLVLVLAAAAAPEVLGGEAGALRATGVFAAAFAWAVVVSTLVGAGRQRIRRDMSASETARRHILERSLAAADAERRRLSEMLHDGALQELMIAGQDLDAALEDEGDEEGLAFARVALDSALDQLRDAVAELHPPALEHGGLQPALSAVLDRACQRGRLAGEVHVEVGADGLRDEMVVSLVRELVANVSKHARAAHVVVRVARAGDWLDLEVADDGVGTTAQRLAVAVGQGHIGLAAARERLEADGGLLRVDSAPGSGTLVRARLRAAPADAVA